MTFFEHVESVEHRALGMPQMIEMLEALHHKHERLYRKVSADAVWKGVKTTFGPERRDAHLEAAENAGFIIRTTGTGGIRSRFALTDKGRAVIGMEKLFHLREIAV